MTPPVMSRHLTNTSRHPPDMSRHPLDTSRHPPNMSRHPPDIPQTRPDTPQTHPDTPQTTPRQRKRILNFNRIICCNLILKFLTDSMGFAQLSPSLFFLKSQWDFPTLTWMNNDHTKVQQARFLKKYKIVSCQLNHLVLEISRLPIRLLKKRTGSKCQGQKIHCFFFKLQNMTGVPKWIRLEPCNKPRTNNGFNWDWESQEELIRVSVLQLLDVKHTITS